MERIRQKNEFSLKQEWDSLLSILQEGSVFSSY